MSIDRDEDSVGFIKVAIEFFQCFLRYFEFDDVFKNADQEGANSVFVHSLGPFLAFSQTPDSHPESSLKCILTLKGKNTSVTDTRLENRYLFQYFFVYFCNSVLL